MQIKGASKRSLEAARAPEGIPPRVIEDIPPQVKTIGDEGHNLSSTFTNSRPIPIPAQGTIKMLATPKASFNAIHDDDVDNLLAECKASVDAAVDRKPMASTRDSPQGPPSESGKPMKSIEYGKYTVDDIDEWLVLSGFYNEAYREKTLSRHRRLSAIEVEKQQLLREEQEERQQLRVGRNSFSTAPAALVPTPNPELAIKEDKQDRSSFSPSSAPSAHITPLKASYHSQKRARDDMKDEGLDEREHPFKVARRQSLERFQIEPLKNATPHGPAPQFRERTSQREDKDKARPFTRPDLFGDYSAPRKAQEAPDTRYSHIRSWNHENVRAVQQDCIWVTQKTNERTFIRAFEESRRVILFFSVNNSKAFQGIAEMGSAPGAAGLPNPSWKSRLHWPATEAFALIWLLKEDIPHHTVRHLVNPLNDSLPAHVGTDGVEIETYVGEQMFSILHDFARRRVGRY